MLGFRLKIKSLAGETPGKAVRSGSSARPILAELERDAERWGLVPEGHDLLFSKELGRLPMRLLVPEQPGGVVMR
jgi:hypothetical protein